MSFFNKPVRELGNGFLHAKSVLVVDVDWLCEKHNIPLRHKRMAATHFLKLALKNNPDLGPTVMVSGNRVLTGHIPRSTPKRPRRARPT